MSAAALGLLLLGARVGLYVEREVALDAETRTALLSGIEDRLRDRTRAEVVLAGPVSCDTAEACAAEIMTQSRAEVVVMLQIFAGPTLIRVVAERFGATPDRSLRVEKDLGRAPSAWGPPLSVLAGALFPEGPIAAVPLLTSASTPPGSPVSRFWPVVSISGGVVMTAVGLVLLEQAGAQRDQIPRGISPLDEWHKIENRARVDETLGRCALGAAIVGLALGLGLLIFD